MRKWKFQGGKVVLALAIAFAALGGYSSPSAAANNKAITAAIDDKNIAFSTPPFLKDGTTLVPFRAIFQALNLTVGWNQQKQQATGTSDTLDIVLTMNSKNAYVNGSKVVLAQAPAVVNGSTMIPLRFVAEVSGGLVYWDSKKQHIDIIFNDAIKVFKSAYYNDTKTLNHWLDNGYNVEDTYNGITPLLHAAMGNAADAVTLLVKRDANPDVKSASNWTPLLWAAYHQNDGMVARLLEYGATENFVTDSSTYELQLAQTRLSNYLKNGSTKLSEKKQYKDTYLVAPFGSTKATVKSKLSTKQVSDTSDTLLHTKAFISGDIGYQQYKFANNKLVSAIYLVQFDINDFESAIDEFIEQLKRVENVYGIDMKYDEQYTSSSVRSYYESVYDTYTKRYEMAIWLDDLTLMSAYDTGEYEVTVWLLFDDSTYTYNVYISYE